MNHAIVMRIVCLAALITCAAHAGPIDIRGTRQLFVDDYLIERMSGAALVLQKPTPREIAIVHDAPWEGNTCGYHTVLKDGDIYRMYYRGSGSVAGKARLAHQVVCYAESRDGVTWTRPDLGIFEFGGSKHNNIVWADPEHSHNFAPFLDDNPDAPASARYKAIARGKPKGLYAFRSPDGIHWSLMSEEPVITEGAFDSQNQAFWDAVRGRYVDYHRGFRNKVRDIMMCTSSDFLNWTDPVWLDYGDATAEHLYTNQITPYHRAPDLLLGFPMRFVPNRRSSDEGPIGVSDGVFMTSRDGVHFNRWTEAIIRPGPQPNRWATRNNMTARGIVETQSDLPGAPNELSIYSTEGYYQSGAVALRRFTYRLDGFVALNAPMSGGEVVTKPLLFSGDRLSINYSTSAAGSVRIEIQDADGKPIDGFALKDCPQIYGDSVDQIIAWKDGEDVKSLAGRPVRLRFILKDADLYAFESTGDH